MSKAKTNGPSEAVQKLSDYKAELITEAENIVLEEFPRKVIEFNEMLKSDRYKYERVPSLLPDTEQLIPIPPVAKKLDNGDSDSSVPPTKKRKLVASTEDGEEVLVVKGLPMYGFKNGVVPGNAELGKLMDEVRPKLRDAVEIVNKVKMWITFLIPRIEDGNNFGVGIQEETLNEVARVEGEAASFLDQMSRYFHSRAKLITKVAKYPLVDDYRRAIMDMDEKQFINIRLVIQEMRNHFATLHDIITKNWEKIKKPRSSNHDSMY